MARGRSMWLLGAATVGSLLMGANRSTGSSLASPIRIGASITSGQFVFTVENTSQRTVALKALAALILYEPNWDATKSARHWAPIDLAKGRPMLSKGEVKLKLQPGRPQTYRVPLGEFVWGNEGGSTIWPNARLRDLVAPGRYVIFLSLGGAGSNRLAVVVDEAGHLSAEP